MQQADIYAHWRDSALVPKFFTVDARAAFIVFIFMVHPNWYTFSAVLVVLAILSALNYYHFSLIAFARLMRTFFGGTRKILIRRR